ncbi:MAG: hypothetical protein ACXVQR_03650 [Solirubrobacteraceae bacterium]
MLLGGLLGAVLLLVAEFTTLYEVRTAASPGPVKSAGTGSHHSYALIPIALLAIVLIYGVWRQQSRPALMAIGVLGVIALLIALLGDLPDAHASGLIVNTSHYINASSSPKTGIYMETLGAGVLIVCSGIGLLLGGTAPHARRNSSSVAAPRSAR